MQHYGGVDTPHSAARTQYIPATFVPRQNPFYCALPYNDVLTKRVTEPEARFVIPWFPQTFQQEGVSVCKDRWVAIRNHEGRVCYAQWSDVGPFRTDHWQYVLGNDRPKPNLNDGAGLDVSPAVRDFLGLRGMDATDWKFRFQRGSEGTLGPIRRQQQLRHGAAKGLHLRQPITAI